MTLEKYFDEIFVEKLKGKLRHVATKTPFCEIEIRFRRISPAVMGHVDFENVPKTSVEGQILTINKLTKLPDFLGVVDFFVIMPDDESVLGNKRIEVKIDVNVFTGKRKLPYEFYGNIK